MKIEFLKPIKGSGNQNRITLQKKGRLNFSASVREEFSITANDYFKIGLDKENKSNKILYLFKVSEKEPESIKINKSGKVHFLNIAFALPFINVDFENKKYIINHSSVVIDKKNFIKLEFIEK